MCVRCVYVRMICVYKLICMNARKQEERPIY